MGKLVVIALFGLLTAGCMMGPAPRPRRARPPADRELERGLPVPSTPAPAPARESEYVPPDFPAPEYSERAGLGTPPAVGVQPAYSVVPSYYRQVYSSYPAYGYTYVAPYSRPYYGWPYRGVYDVHEHHDHGTGKSTFELTPNTSYPWWWPSRYGKFDHHDH
ncbi:MAG TPA: hypothetical protein VI643_02570 [Planctomycetota bacterium]|nr:hypothetical protein [Planctomycetota bacterium]